jgi:hypothetical protein
MYFDLSEPDIEVDAPPKAAAAAAGKKPRNKGISQEPAEWESRINQTPEEDAQQWESRFISEFLRRNMEGRESIVTDEEYERQLERADKELSERLSLYPDTPKYMRTLILGDGPRDKGDAQKAVALWQIRMINAWRCSVSLLSDKNENAATRKARERKGLILARKDIEKMPARLRAYITDHDFKQIADDVTRVERERQPAKPAESTSSLSWFGSLFSRGSAQPTPMSVDITDPEAVKRRMIYEREDLFSSQRMEIREMYAEYKTIDSKQKDNYSMYTRIRGTIAADPLNADKYKVIYFRETIESMQNAQIGITAAVLALLRLYKTLSKDIDESLGNTEKAIQAAADVGVVIREKYTEIVDLIAFGVNTVTVLLDESLGATPEAKLGLLKSAVLMTKFLKNNAVPSLDAEGSVNEGFDLRNKIVTAGVTLLDADLFKGTEQIARLEADVSEIVTSYIAANPSAADTLSMITPKDIPELTNDQRELRNGSLALIGTAQYKIYQQTKLLQPATPEKEPEVELTYDEMREILLEKERARVQKQQEAKELAKVALYDKQQLEWDEKYVVTGGTLGKRSLAAQLTEINRRMFLPGANKASLEAERKAIKDVWYDNYGPEFELWRAAQPGEDVELVKQMQRFTIAPKAKPPAPSTLTLATDVDSLNDMGSDDFELNLANRIMLLKSPTLKSQPKLKMAPKPVPKKAAAKPAAQAEPLLEM